jgi:small subunit ribosomal protein S18
VYVSFEFNRPDNEGKSERTRGEGRVLGAVGKKNDSDRRPEYKDPVSLGRFISDGGKITPARITKSSIAQQKRISEAIKRARSLALLPIGMAAADDFYRPELISPSPFNFE